MNLGDQIRNDLDLGKVLLTGRDLSKALFKLLQELFEVKSDVHWPVWFQVTAGAVIQLSRSANVTVAEVVQGDRGLIAWWNLRHGIEKADYELAAVTAQKKTLEHRVTLLRPESLDRDMLEERARAMLGVVHKDDLIVPDPSAETLSAAP